jgi:hypothetical protein
MPILTSGKFLLGRGLATDPREAGDTSDWAQLTEVELSDHDASTVGAYWSAGVGPFLGSGFLPFLTEFDGETVSAPDPSGRRAHTSYPLITDPDLIEQWADAHPGFDPGELYQP